MLNTSWMDAIILVEVLITSLLNGSTNFFVASSLYPHAAVKPLSLKKFMLLLP